MMAAALIAVVGVASALLGIATVREVIRDRRRPIRVDRAYSSRRPHLER